MLLEVDESRQLIVASAHGIRPVMSCLLPSCHDSDRLSIQMGVLKVVAGPNSRSSCAPIDAPEGTKGFAQVPRSRLRMARTLGLPRELSISIASISTIRVAMFKPSRM